MGDSRTRITDAILRFRIPILAALVGLSIFFAWQWRDLLFEVSPEGMRLSDHPDTRYYESHVMRFGSDQIIVLVVESENIFRPEVLAKIDFLTREIETCKAVNGVVSITSVEDIRGGDLGLEVAPVTAAIPGDAVGVEMLRGRLLENPIFIDNLFARDGTMAAIVVTVEAALDHAHDRKMLVARLQELIDEHAGDGLRIYMAGYPVIKTVLPDLLVSDQRRFIPFILLLISVVLFISFRTLRGILLPGITVFTAILWTMGLLVVTGRRIEIITNVLPPLVQVIGLAAAIHILTHFNEEYSRCGDKKEALARTLRYIILPCFLTSFTTAVGFGSLMVNRIDAIRDFGAFAAFGVMAAFIVAITFVPILLHYLGPPAGTVKSRIETGAMSAVLQRIGDFNLHHRWAAVIGCGILMALAAVGVGRLKVETTLIKYLKPDNPLAVSVEQIEGHLAGTSSLDVVFEASEEGGIKSPEVLAEIEQVQAFLESIPEVTKTVSIVDFLKRMNQAMHDGDAAAYRIPESHEAVSQYLLLFSMSGDEEDLERYVTYDYSAATISARLLTVSSSRMEQVIAGIREHLAAGDSSSATVKLTGVALLVTETIDAIVRGQLQSLGVALILISILMVVFFRSIKLGLISMIPNVIPIFLTLGVMGLWGIPINTATAIISCVAIGIAVDDTIHFLSRFRSEFEIDGDYVGSMYRSLKGVGRAMVFTSLVNTGGFLVLLLSNFKPIIYFGILMGLTMMSALIGDLVVLPVCLLVFKPLRHAADR